MPGSEGSRSDHAISDTLSARSYLGLAHEGPVHLQSEADTPHSKDESIPEKPIVQGNSGPRLRPRVKRGSPKQSKPSDSEKAEIEDPHTVDRPVRKRGRPRLETTKDAAAIEVLIVKKYNQSRSFADEKQERRLQIRRAQRTYRQKKEATIQALKTRVDQLEQTLQNVSDLLGADQDGMNALSASSARPDDLARARQLALAEINKARSFPVKQDQSLPPGADTLHDVFGYQVSYGQKRMDKDTDLSNDEQITSQHHARSPSPLLNRLFPSTTIYTYSYQESNISRRLQRFCLEHTYRWLADPSTDPAHLTRVFGLLPCIHDMPGVRRTFRRVLHSEIGGPLEVTKLPYYTLGGASTHYPRIGLDGQPVYPENLRRPGKVLRRMSRILRRGGIQDWDEDWSGDAEPDDGHDQVKVERGMSEEDRLRALDLEGEWFDCHDVQGYLEHRGVVLNGSSLWLEVPAAVVGELYGLSPAASSSQFYLSPEQETPSDTSGSQYTAQSGYVLDVECFFDCEVNRISL